MKKRERYKLSLSVFMILVQNDKVLLIKRKNTGWMDGSYSLPAGAIDGNETLTRAVIRETKEEVGVEIQSEDISLVHTMHNLTNKEEWIGAYFVTTKWKGNPTVKEPHKHSEVKWFELSKLPKKTIPYVKQALESYQQQQAYSEFEWE